MLNENIFIFRDDSPLADILSSLHDEMNAGLWPALLMVRLGGLKIRRPASWDMLLACGGLGRNDYVVTQQEAGLWRRTKMIQQPLTVARNFVCRNVHAIRVRRENPKNYSELWKNAPVQS